MGTTDDEFDTAAAVTRSMLGWGVLVGAIYLVIGLAQALSREGFDLSTHQLSLLMLGEGGWIQRVNLIGCGVLVLVAAAGFGRAMAGSRSGRVTASAVGVFGLGMVGSGVFAPDPMLDFPPGVAESDPTSSGILHLTFGMIQFVALAVACFAGAHWADRRGDGQQRRYSTVSGVVVLVGFVGGAALSTSPIGVLGLWIAVVTSFLWIALTAAYLWRTTPHPDVARRVAPA